MHIKYACIATLTLALIAGCSKTTPREQPPDTSFAAFDTAARAGASLTVAFFGASLTWGANASDHARTSYRACVARYLEDRYPRVRFTFVDGAIGGTGSMLGVFRLQRDCLEHDPDLVFLDFSANDDIYTDGPEKLATYESLVRRIITEGKCPLVPVIFPFKWNADPGTAGDMLGRIAHHKIAAAYGAPVGDAILHIQELVAEDVGVADKIWNIDAIHPGDYGYRIFADAALQAYETGLKAKMVCRAPEQMLHADTYMSWSRNRISSLKALPDGWKPGLVSRSSAWYDAYMPRWLDDVMIAANTTVRTGGDGMPIKTPVDVAPLVTKFKAATVMLFGEETRKSGQFKAFIDGQHVPRQLGEESSDLFDLSSEGYGGNRQFNAVIARGLDPDRVHELKLVPIFAKGEEQELRLESICLAGGEARIVE